MRRLIDLVVAGALLTLAAPLMLLVALADESKAQAPFWCGRTALAFVAAVSRC